MSWRIEVRRTRSPLWSWFVRHARMFPGYRLSHDGVDEVHSVDQLEFDQAVKFWELTGDWKGVSIYKDGELVSTRRFRGLAWKAQWGGGAGTCPRCSAPYRVGTRGCCICGHDLRPIDGEVVREIGP